MKITLFHAGDGDCLLLTSRPDGEGKVHTMLVDGGRKGAFEGHARDSLYALRRLDVVCVSHIDEDHIAGILGMIEDEVEWRVHDFESAEGGSPAAPGHPRPPAIGEIWHNALWELVGDELEPDVQGTLSTAAGILAGSADPEVRDLATRLDDLATGERSAMELSRRISGSQLDIPRNRPRDRLMLRGGGDDLDVGPMHVRAVGPSDDDIRRLRESWKAWIDSNRAALRELQREMLDEERRLGNLAAGTVARPLLTSSLGEGAGGVTEPNLASLMLFVEEDETTVLLTGDGVSDEILDGLDDLGVTVDGRLHVSVLKVQHHGALANVTEDFVRRISADHYVFAGNGAHDNPELEVVEAFAKARIEGMGGDPPLRPDEDFTFWFSTSETTPGLTASRKTHMKAVKAKADAWRARSGGHMSVRMVKEGSVEVLASD